MPEIKRIRIRYDTKKPVENYLWALIREFEITDKAMISEFGRNPPRTKRIVNILGLLSGGKIKFSTDWELLDEKDKTKGFTVTLFDIGDLREEANR